MNNDELFLREKIEEYGRVYNQGALIPVLYNKKIIPSNVTEEEILELFDNTNVLYFYSDSKDVNDFEKTDYAPWRKGYLKGKVVKLNTDLSKYKEKLYIGFNYNSKTNSYAGVYIGDLNSIYLRNFDNNNNNIKHNNIYNKYTDNNEIKFKSYQLSKKSKEISDNKQQLILKSSLQQSYFQEKYKTPYEHKDLEYVANSIHDDIFNIEEWGISEEERKYKILKYLTYFNKAIINKYNNETLDKNCYMILTSKDNDEYLLVNSKLLNKYAEWIYLLYQIKSKMDKPNNKIIKDIYGVYYLSTLLDISKKNIDISQLPIKALSPVKFYNDKSELIFDGELEDFKLEISSYNFSHIIEKRRERLPEIIKNSSITEISYKIKNSIENAIKMSKADYNYIIPIYNIQSDKIQYMLPLRCTFEFDEQIETVLIVKKTINNEYTLATVLTIEDAFETARILNRPTASWFK